MECMFEMGIKIKPRCEMVNMMKRLAYILSFQRISKHGVAHSIMHMIAPR